MDVYMHASCALLDNVRVLSYQLIRDCLFLQMGPEDQLDRGCPGLQGGLLYLLHQLIQFVPSYIVLHIMYMYTYYNKMCGKECVVLTGCPGGPGGPRDPVLP